MTFRPTCPECCDYRYELPYLYGFELHNFKIEKPLHKFKKKVYSGHNEMEEENFVVHRLLRGKGGTGAAVNRKPVVWILQLLRTGIITLLGSLRF